MHRKRDLILTNLLALLVLLAVLLAGWWDAAAFGLAVLVIMDLLAVLRERNIHLRPGPGASLDASPERGQGPIAESEENSGPTELDTEE